MNVTYLLSIVKCFPKLPILKKERNFLKLTDMNGKEGSWSDITIYILLIIAV